MLLYVTVGTNDLERAGRFYDAVLPLLGFRRQKQAQGEIGYGALRDLLSKVRETVTETAVTDGWGKAISPATLSS